MKLEDLFTPEEFRDALEAVSDYSLGEALFNPTLLTKDQFCTALVVLEAVRVLIEKKELAKNGS